MFGRIEFVTVLLTVAGGVVSRAATDEAKQNCEQSGYKLHGASCYKLHDTPVTWDKATSACEAEGAYLVIINDTAEADIINIITKDSSTTYDWVGLRDETGSNDWRSVHGDSVSDIYNVWTESVRKYKCGALKYTAELDDVPCHNEYSFVCEK